MLTQNREGVQKGFLLLLIHLFSCLRVGLGIENSQLQRRPSLAAACIVCFEMASVSPLITRVTSVGAFQANCIIIGDPDTKDAVMVDPGDDAATLLETVKSLGVNIKMILLTHAHIDHVGAVPRVREATGSKVFLHAADQALWLAC